MLATGALLAAGCGAPPEASAEQQRAFQATADRDVSAADTTFASELSAAFRAAARGTLPSLVFVTVEREGPTPRAAPPDFLRRFFDFDRPGQSSPAPPIASGSGFVIDTGGYIVTNQHVVAHAARVDVRTFGGREFPAEVVGRDSVTDIALLKIDPDGHRLAAAVLGTSDQLLIGDWVLALGSPLGLDFTVTAGIVSAKDRQLTGRETTVESFIQTDAAINPGNSGGPLIDLAGRVVGVNTAIYGSDRFVGYGFAVPINIVLEVANDLREFGHARRPRLGIRVGRIDAVDAEVYGLDLVQGAEVVTVDREGPAAGQLEVGDVILAVDGEPIGSANELTATLLGRDPGDVVALRVVRDQSERTVRVRLGEFGGPQARPAAPAQAAETGGLLGIVVEGVTPELVRRYEIGRTSGVVITGVRPGSQAARAGVREGQVLLAVNDEPAQLPTQVRAQAGRLSPGDVVSLRVIDPELGETIINYRVRGR